MKKKILLVMVLLSLVFVLFFALYYYIQIQRRYAVHQAVDRLCQSYGGVSYFDNEGVLCIQVGNEFDDKGLDDLSQLLKSIPDLPFEIPDWDNTISLSLQNTNITDKVFLNLQGTKHIAMLNVSNTNISDTSIPVIESLFDSQLTRMLFTAGSEITIQGEKRLRKFFIDNRCTVIFNGASVHPISPDAKAPESAPVSRENLAAHETDFKNPIDETPQKR